MKTINQTNNGELILQERNKIDLEAKAQAGYLHQTLC